MTPDMPTLPIALYVGAAPQPGDDRPMPPGCWQRCPCCRGTGEAVRSRVVAQVDDWLITRPSGVGVCGACSGRGFVRF